MFAVISLSQCQNIRQIILFQEIFVFRSLLFDHRLQVSVFKIFSGIVQIRPAHLHNVRIFTGSDSCLQILCQPFIHIRVIFFDNLDIGMLGIKIGNQFFNRCTAEAFGGYMPIFNLHFFVNTAFRLIITAAAAGKDHRTGSCQKQCRKFLLHHHFYPPLFSYELCYV